MENNTLYPSITGSGSSLTLPRDILWGWIVIIINTNSLTENLRHVFLT